MPVKIFFSYAQEDEALLKRLKTHLNPFQRRGNIEMWDGRNISAGSEWEAEIDRYINEAHIILLLVSPDFIASDYCYGKEMQRAIERHERGEARVIPVILRPVHWQGLLGKLQALPRNAPSIMSSNWNNLDEAFFDVAAGIFYVMTTYFDQEFYQNNFDREFDLSLLQDGFQANLTFPPQIPPLLPLRRALQGNVFILGRPGSGKTTAIRYLAQELKYFDWFTTRINEYEILYKIFQVDRAKQKFIATEYGGFDILDFSIFSETSREIERTIQNLASYKTFILVELARDEYKRALKQFDIRLLRDSYFLFIDADVETCIRRIHQRVLLAETQDDYFVSEAMLRSYYHKDNWEYMTHQFHRDYDISKNILSIKNTRSQQELLERVKIFAKLINDRENNWMLVEAE